VAGNSDPTDLPSGRTNFPSTGMNHNPPPRANGRRKACAGESRGNGRSDHEPDAGSPLDPWSFEITLANGDSHHGQPFLSDSRIEEPGARKLNQRGNFRRGVETWRRAKECPCTWIVAIA
jgi:hypothetical protein